MSITKGESHLRANRRTVLKILFTVFHAFGVSVVVCVCLMCLWHPLCSLISVSVEFSVFLEFGELGTYVYCGLRVHSVFCENSVL